MWGDGADGAGGLSARHRAPGAPSLDSTVFDLAPFGYREYEFFVSGTATGYVSDEALSADGVWSARPAVPADYTTRILVRRPTARAMLLT